MNSDDSTGTHLDHVVGQGGGVLAVVRDIYHRERERLLQPCEFKSQLATKVRIETRERLVQEEHLRFTNDCPCESHTLLFAAGELVRVARRELLNPNEPECLLYSAPAIRSRYKCRTEHEIEILSNRQVRPQREVLKDEAEPSFMRRYDDATSRRSDAAIEGDFS